MSGKATKRIRRELRPLYLRMAREAEARRKVPPWRVSMAAVGFPGFCRRWLVRWEKRNTEALRVAMKKTVRAVRAGPQPRPHHLKDWVQPDKPWPRPPAKGITPGELE